MTLDEKSRISADEDYGFDVSGFIHVPQVLSAEEVSACNEEIDAGGDAGTLELPALQQHPVLTGYLEALCGAGFAIDRPPSLVGDGPEGTAVPLTNGPPEDRRRLRYANYRDTRECRGLRLFVALTPTGAEGGVVLVTSSHNRNTEPPADFLAGAMDLGMTEEPQLQAGDVLICAATTLYGVRGRPGRVIEIQYLNSRARPTAGYAEIEAPDWFTELTPAQQAVVGTRMTGRGGTVVSDGERAWVTEAEEQPPSVTLNLDEHSQPDPHELWFWDVRGYLVLRGVMDEEWLVAANRALDYVLENQDSFPEGHRSRIEEVPEQALRENDWKWPEDTSPRLGGEINRPRVGGLYELPAPHCDPFRRMIGHPAIVKRLNWILGYGFRESTEPMCCVYPKGTTGGSLHGENPGSHTVYNGRQLVEQTNVAWALQDESPGFGEDSGGFLCVPGSHKAKYPIPGGLTTSIDLPQVQKPALKAGDVLFFGGVAHGTTAWRSDRMRRTTIQFMGSSNVALPPGKKGAGWRWSSDLNNPANASKAKA
ncbi:MAG: phytanoyl-CoA dioxygenase family protein [Candidatus Latescibacterota bacterium]|nr:phytanoyl-CoA dioxygenase family protein [Candidatus Latescibacterota bacterium]